MLVYFQYATSSWDIATGNPEAERWSAAYNSFVDLNWAEQSWPKSEINLTFLSCQYPDFQKHKNALKMHRNLLLEISLAACVKLSDIW